MRRSPLLPISALAVLLLITTACGGDDAPATDAAPATETPDEPAPEAPDEPAPEEPAPEEPAPEEPAPEEPGPYDTPPDADAEVPAEEDPVGGGVVTARDLTFEPSDLEVAVGDAVEFTNEDTVRHTVTAGTPDDVLDTFDEELDGEGAVATITFDEAGTFDYFCQVHPAMTGTVAVG